MPKLSNQFESIEQGFQPAYETAHGRAHVTPSGYVHNVFIRHDQRGQGHGTALMSQITDHADHLGVPLSLHAREDLHPWYQRLGFQRDTSPEGRASEDFLQQPFLVRQPRR